MVMDAGTDGTGHDTERWDTDRPEAGSDSGRSDGTVSGGSATPEQPDVRRLAQDWITLWQSELSAMAADPEVREAWQGIMAIWAGTAAAMLRGLPRQQPAASDNGTGWHSGATDASRASSPAAAPDPRDAEIKRLADHVAALERRLAELERGGDPPIHSGSRSRRRPRQ